MKIEDQVCSLELAKKLKELGVKQESLFYYRAYENPLNGHVSEDKVTDDFWGLYYKDDKYSKSCDWEISAFAVAELGEMLSKYSWISEYTNGMYYLFFQGEHIISDDNEADARAKMLIYLIENGLVTGKEI